MEQKKLGVKLKGIQLLQFSFNKGGITDKDINTFNTKELQIISANLMNAIEDAHLQQAKEATTDLLKELNIKVEKNK
jgi:hypothetical protein